MFLASEGMIMHPTALAHKALQTLLKLGIRSNESVFGALYGDGIIKRQDSVMRHRRGLWLFK